MATINIPSSELPRIVILGAGFAGLNLARKLSGKGFQVVLIDKNNYHQFQPLFYQVAMSGLEPSSISFPLRKLFQSEKETHIRIAEVEQILPEEKKVKSSLGTIYYDELVIALGADTNFYGNERIAKNAYTLKSTGESLYLRNSILVDLERALIEKDYNLRQKYLDIVIVGGGPTGVELAGALAELKKFIIPKDYPMLDASEIDIYLIQMGDAVLNTMSEKAQKDSLKFLRSLGVKVKLGVSVKDYDGKVATLSNGENIPTYKLIWAAGIKPNLPSGIDDADIVRGRISVGKFNNVLNYDSIYALGDLAYMETEKFPKGHPQVAQVAIQQAQHLADNLKRKSKGKEFTPWKYKDKGSMATVGRNKAVVDLPTVSFSGFFAWVLWLGVHLFSLIGAKNKFFVFMNWIANYVTYDQSLRLILTPTKRAADQKPDTMPDD